jgi:hypothetical protein
MRQRGRTAISSRDSCTQISPGAAARSIHRVQLVELLAEGSVNERRARQITSQEDGPLQATKRCRKSPQKIVTKRGRQGQPPGQCPSGQRRQTASISGDRRPSQRNQPRCISDHRSSGLQCAIEQMQGTNTSTRWFNASIHHSADTEAGVWMQALLRLPG